VWVRAQFCRLQKGCTRLASDKAYQLLANGGWFNQVGSWITEQIMQAYHQYGVGSRATLYLTKKDALDSQPQMIEFTSCNTVWVRAQFCRLQKGCTRLASDKAYQLLANGGWFSPDTPASSTIKAGHNDIAEILLKVAFDKINQSIKQMS
jgi:hypothetical protein